MVGASVAWNWWSIDQHAREMAVERGQFVFRTVESVRLWNAGHGGVYAQVTPDTPPNPYLDVPHRDITSTAGQRLTLINPAYMTRQLSGLIREHSDLRVHLTSLKPLNPANRADAWEAAALTAFEQGEKERSALVEEDGRLIARYMAPLVTQPPCLDCHAEQGYQLGDVRGGVSVSFPAESLLHSLGAQKRNLLLVHLAAWLLLLAVGAYASQRIRSQLLQLRRAKAEQDRVVERRTRELREEVATRARAEAQVRLLIESSGEGIIGLDRACRCTLANPKAVSLLGYADASEIMGRDFREVAHRQGDKSNPGGECPVVAVCQHGVPIHTEGQLFQRVDGSRFSVELRAHPLFAEGELAGAVLTFSDITRRQELQEAIWHQANYDSLTGLPNRNLFRDRLEQAQNKAAREGDSLALLFIDLDRFKAVNDALGHEAGDELLRQAARRIEHCFRASDTVARMGGDEFTAVLVGLREPEAVRALGMKLIRELERPFTLAGQEATISASIGIAFFPDDAREIGDLMRAADRAMYAAKAAGRAACRCYRDLGPADRLPPADDDATA